MGPENAMRGEPIHVHSVLTSFVFWSLDTLERGAARCALSFIPPRLAVVASSSCFLFLSP